MVNLALDGNEVWVTHKGRRFKIAPENMPGNRLSRITPLEVINPKFTKLNDPCLLAEMTHAWEKDWADL